jgi:hypothetical protein
MIYCATLWRRLNIPVAYFLIFFITYYSPRQRCGDNLLAPAAARLSVRVNIDTLFGPEKTFSYGKIFFQPSAADARKTNRAL